jgi:hypothetical protein
MSIERRIEALEEQAVRDFDEMLDWVCQWTIANLAPERIGALTVKNWLTSSEQARMMAAMPKALQDKADAAWPIVSVNYGQP